MTLWRFLRSQSSVSPTLVITVAGVSGLANALLLAIVNSAAHVVSGDGGSNTRASLFFLVTIVLYILTQRYLLRISTIEVERIIAKQRILLSDKIRHTDLHAIEGLGRAQLYAAVNTETMVMSQAAAPLIIAAQGAVLVFFSLVYIYVLSPAAFLLTIAIVLLGVSIHFQNRKQLQDELERSTRKENEFFDALTHLLEGFKEVKLSQARSDDLFQQQRRIALAAADLKTRSGTRYADYYIFTQVVFYLLIGAIVFVLPGLSEVYSEQVTRITAAILFIIGPLTIVVGVVPIVRAASHAVNNITRMEAILEKAQAAARERENGPTAAPASFEAIEIEGLTFSYRDEQDRPQFTVGPIDLTIRRGEILLIVGGNGSGKSTFLKLLTALYYPASGSVRLDGRPVHSFGYRPYRELFSAVFSDYHLFDRLYGMPDVDERRIQELLKLMQLDRKTVWRNGRFENQDLSTGQKKRLALIVALLEDKPIYVFDEWAADQDPPFRKFFYESLLPDMKRRGKTIVAATHDDRYFPIGDRVLKMEFGRFDANGKGQGPAPPAREHA